MVTSVISDLSTVEPVLHVHPSGQGQVLTNVVVVLQ